MLTEGVRMTLMIGPAVPVPVPSSVLDALSAVEVTNATEGPSGFRLTFDLAKNSPLETLFLLSGGAGIPLVRVVIAVTVRGQTTVLMDGVMTEHDVSPGEGGRSRLTVTGEDLSRVMDYLELDGFPFPAMPAEARVALIIAKYAMFGLIPLVVPTLLLDVPIPVDRIPRQQGTDLAYLKKLADEVGYVFYVDAGPTPLTNVAYWGPPVKVGPLQPALNTDMDAHTNVESLSFRFDSQGAKLPILWLHEKLTKIPVPIPVPDVSPLSPPLGVVPPLPLNIEQISGVAKRTATAASLKAMAVASRSQEAMEGNGSLDVLRDGRVLKARQLVGVRGAGAAFDGPYYVDSVTHNLERGSYKQSFRLTRNGLLSILPKVPA